MGLANTWIHDFGKFKMVLDRTDTDISKQVEKSGWYSDESFEASLFEKYLKKGMTVLDLGGNIGFYTILARSIVGPKGRVFSFEPFPGNVNLIRASIKENSFTNSLHDFPMARSFSKSYEKTSGTTEFVQQP